MDTYKITTVTGEVKLFVVDSGLDEMHCDEVVNTAKAKGILPQDAMVDTVEFWKGFDPNETKTVTFYLGGQFQIPKGCKEHLGRNGDIAGFELPDGSILRIQLVMEREAEEYEDLGTCDLEKFGITGFGELNENDIQIEE